MSKPTPSFIVSYVRWILRWRWPVLIACLLAAAIAASGLRYLGFTSDFRVYFGPKNPELLAYEALEDIYTKTDNILFVLQPKDKNVFTRKTLGILKHLTEEAWQIPHAIRVDSITNFQHTEAVGDDLTVADLVERPESLTDAKLAKVKKVALNEPTLVKRLIADDAGTTGVLVTLQFPGKDHTDHLPRSVIRAEKMVADLRAAHPDLTVALRHRLAEAGADLIELGIPFSDPMADGPVIQLASERALVHNTSLADVIAIVAEFRKENDIVPVILMGYLNPLEAMGYARFASTANEAGVDGILIVDLPAEEALELKSIMHQRELDMIFLIAPNTSEKRMETICRAASGYLYYVSLKGVTGSNQINIESVANKLALIRQKTKLPIGVGFGIKDPQTAASIAKISDAVIVGSVLVDQIAKLQDEPEKISAAIFALIQAMRTEMDISTPSLQA